MELQYTPSKTDDYKVPDSASIEYKGVTYTLPIRTMKAGEYEDSILRLMSGTTDLGSCLFYPAAGTLHINTLISRNMIRNDVHMIKFHEAVRPADRVPVGTLLIEAVKQIAQHNGVAKIQLISMEDPKLFYEKKGFREVNGEPLVYEYLVPTKKARRSRTDKTRRRRGKRRRSLFSRP
jgi:hypothetical protein